jgi:predicted Zn-dependent peptidase
VRYIFKPHVSKISTICAAFGAGTRVEYGSQYPSGIAHFMEHLRFKGSAKYTNAELNEKISILGGDSNAWTSQDSVVYHLEVPTGSEVEALEVLAEIALNPIFPDTEIEKEKNVVVNELGLEEDFLNAYEVMYSKVFDNALGLHAIGTEESVRSISKNHLMDFNRDFYGRDKLLVVVSGQVDVRKQVSDIFGNDGVFNFTPATNANYPASFTHEFEKEGAFETSIIVSFGSPEIEKLAREKRAVCEVLNQIIGGSDSRLFQKVREELGLVYGIGSDIELDMDGCLFEISTSTSQENKDAVLEAIGTCVDEFLKGGVRKNELLKAKNCLRSSFYRGLDTSHNVASDAIREQLYGFSKEQIMEEIENLTEADVLEAARIIFGGNEYVVIGTGNGD